MWVTRDRLTERVYLVGCLYHAGATPATGKGKAIVLLSLAPLPTRMVHRGTMVLKKSVDIAPARGKLGILMPGMGAVATTFIARVMTVRRGLAKPIGSLTQMGTIRLGKRTDNRSPKINEFVPLAGLDDLVFGGWDIFRDSAYEAASKAGVLTRDH